MSRIRCIKPDFFMDEELAAVSPLSRLLFIGLWTLADRDGRLEHRPARIKAQVFPYHDADVQALLVELERRAFIVRYEAGGKDCISIRNFAKHQRPHPKETSYGLPPPPEPGTSTPCREISRQGVDASRRVPVVDGDGNGDGCGNGERQSPTETVGRADAQARPPAGPSTPHLPGIEVPPAEAKPKPDSAVAQWARKAAEARRGVIPPTAVQETKFRGDQWKRLGEALKTHGVLAMDAALALFLKADGYPRENDYALGIFVAQAGEWVTRTNAAAARARAGGDPVGLPAQPVKLVEM